jgi:hypothetical protein
LSCALSKATIKTTITQHENPFGIVFKRWRKRRRRRENNRAGI